ncbi:hypothetical protein MMAD_56070 (plasmid) [Mycolicibacterium madagascariense]|uniref:Uncharacterized protein n=1 Tax=Mycolicibacterium madagascariense TaxID=212765 RepID=A0A7I7XQK8_9MYCO|nr:hypothetical protein [Mycolicibacterium madagascariense]BBZ31312.1 hypothetical protein MMAD_56070 [Mycolicibacterium madagascariense]
MTAARTSKAEARRRAVEAARRANEEHAAREKANLKDATVLLHAIDKLDAIGEWKKERRAELRAQADAQLEREEAKRVGDEREAAGAAIERMRERGETLTTIATKHDLGIGIVRAMARHAPKAGNPLPRNGSHALGPDVSGTGEAAAGGAVGPVVGEPPAEAASA